MPFCVTIPTLGKPKNVKDAIISILTNEWPLSAKKIYFRVRNKGMAVSYQAVHKSISDLVTDNVLQRTERNYRIDHMWINKLHDFSSSLDYKYSDFPIGDNMVFNSLRDMDFFIISMMEKMIITGEMEIHCSHWGHTWWPLFASRKEYSILKKIPNPKQLYITCNSDGVVARWCKKIYENIGININVGICIEDNFDFMIYGNMVIQMYLPYELRNEINNAFSVNSIHDIDVDKIFTNIFEKETKINLIIIKNNDVANIFRRRILNYFK